MFTDRARGRSWISGAVVLEPSAGLSGGRGLIISSLIAGQSQVPPVFVCHPGACPKGSTVVGMSVPAQGRGAALQGRLSGLLPLAPSILHVLGLAFDIRWPPVPWVGGRCQLPPLLVALRVK